MDYYVLSIRDAKIVNDEHSDHIMKAFKHIYFNSSVEAIKENIYAKGQRILYIREFELTLNGVTFIQAKYNKRTVKNFFNETEQDIIINDLLDIIEMGGNFKEAPLVNLGTAFVIEGGTYIQ